MKVLVVGGTGFIGSRIVRACLARDHDVTVATRSRQRPKGLPGPVHALTWDTQGPLPAAGPFDAVVNEAGATIGGRRWTAAYKREMEDSRITTNRRLAEWIRDQPTPPKVFVSASAVGYYGYAPGKPVDEDGAPGDDFLARLCQRWEQAAEAAGPATRVVLLRQGIVLAPEHGALALMLPFFRLGLGGPVGNGAQPFPWIAPDDLVRFALRALEDDSVRGPYNLVAPQRVTNRQFTKALGRVLHRPAVLPVPPFALRAMYGEGADVVTTGQDVVPRRLEESGFVWQHPELEPALAALLGRRG